MLKNILSSLVAVFTVVLPIESMNHHRIAHQIMREEAGTQFFGDGILHEAAFDLAVNGECNYCNQRLVSDDMKPFFVMPCPQPHGFHWECLDDNRYNEVFKNDVITCPLCFHEFPTIDDLIMNLSMIEKIVIQVRFDFEALLVLYNKAVIFYRRMLAAADRSLGRHFRYLNQF